MAFLYVRGLARGDHHREELLDLCRRAGVSCEQVMAEARSVPDLYADVLSNHERVTDPYSAISAVACVVKKSPAFRTLLEQKMSLGSNTMKQLGNLYTGALPAWLAAGFEEAARNNVELDNAPMVAVGYGSGDAAEAIPLRVVPGWQEAAKRIGLTQALDAAINLTRNQYESIHDGIQVDLDYEPVAEFVISHVGDQYEKGFQDLAVEYYKYVS